MLWTRSYDPKQLVDAVETIMRKAQNVVKIFITSRDNSTLCAMLPTPRLIRVTNEDNGRDVRLFAKATVRESVSSYKLLMGKVTHDLEDKLAGALAAGAGEMFLWVNL